MTDRPTSGSDGSTRNTCPQQDPPAAPPLTARKQPPRQGWSARRAPITAAHPSCSASAAHLPLSAAGADLSRRRSQTRAGGAPAAPAEAPAAASGGARARGGEGRGCWEQARRGGRGARGGGGLPGDRGAAPDVPDVDWARNSSLCLTRQECAVFPPRCRPQHFSRLELSP